MPTFEQVRQKIARNFPRGPVQSERRRIEFDRETATTIISLCGTYRIVKMEDPANPGLFGYGLQLAATPTSAPKHLCGPFPIAKDAREAAQRHADGEPLQADLA